ncbi:putative Succinoglycan biosynthesis transport protein ExoP [Crenothrix polyspora]|uniref:non-specific protein-tyrosine kinase n=1 Tax=Crenothrix polyspora TaxID=360316 RepID=A0A1R4H3A6_9GAMM|nr:polysaccharide biosynthesis tyrosine autokinase [Crenothrix polyspora]SJM90723.1 putative Succinoglycan biosynthesis transport protein ExoP [Crenothrix polyspora]
MSNESVQSESTNVRSFFATPSASDGISIRQIFAIIWRRKWLILAIVLGFTILAATILWSIAPRYTGEAQMMIENRGRDIVKREAPSSGSLADAETIAGQIQVLRSPELAREVIRELNLDQDPEFNTIAVNDEENIDDLSVSDTATKDNDNAGKFFTQEEKSIDNMVDSSGVSEKEYRSELRWTQIIDKFLKNLDVQQQKDSRVITVKFTSKNRITASRVTNTIVNLYIKRQLDGKFEATKMASSWLNQQILISQKQVKASEDAVELYRKNSGLLNGKDGTLIQQQISEVNSQLMVAKSDRSLAAARLRQAESLLNSRGDIGSTSEVLQSSLIQGLRTQESELQRKIAELSTDYGPKHPKLLNFIAELNSLQDKIEVEVRKIVNGLANELEITDTRITSLQENMEVLKGQLAKDNTDKVQLDALNRDAEANRILLNTFVARFKEVSAQENMEVQQPDATIISRAGALSDPTFPKKKPILGLAIVASGILGLLLAFLLEYMIPGYRSGEQIEKATGLPSLGFVPLLKGAGKVAGMSLDNYILQYPRSALAHSINALRWNLDISGKGRAPKTILVTSTLPKEGKTTAAACLARMYAMAGKRVLLIDGDSYRAGILKVFQLSDAPGLSDVLMEEQTLDNVIWTEKATGLDVLRSGKQVPDLTSILASPQFDAFLKSLDKDYDAIIIDSPPIAANADALILSQKVDTTILVVRWAVTKQEAVNWGIKKLAQANGNVAGVLLSMVDAQEYSSYGYGDSGMYLRQFDNYYTE